jgi:hypothetical protein
MAMQRTAASPHSPSFSELPEEIQLHILTFLDIPELLATSRVGNHERQERRSKEWLLMHGRQAITYEY